MSLIAVPRAILLLVLSFQPPETTLLECTADTYIPGFHGAEDTLKLEAGSTLLLAFRMGAIEGWRIGKAVLLLHLAESSKAGEVRIAPIQGRWNERTDATPRLGEFRPVQEQSKADGWIAIAVPAGLLEQGVLGIALQGNGQKVHARESSQFSPYLAVQRKK
jgi:hypothetical protein